MCGGGGGEGFEGISCRYFCPVFERDLKADRYALFRRITADRPLH